MLTIIAIVSLPVLIIVIGTIRNLLGENKTRINTGNRPNSSVKSWTRK